MKKKDKAGRKGRRYQLAAALIVLVILLSAFSGWLFVKKGFKIPGSGRIPDKEPDIETVENEEDDILPESNNAGEDTDSPDEDEDAVNESITNENTAKKDAGGKAAETELSIELQPEDAEVFEDGRCVFRCFSEAASQSGMYEWQHYSKEKREWETIGTIDHAGNTSEIVDENIELLLKENEGSKQSVLVIKNSGADKDGYLIRCKAYDDTKRERYCVVSTPVVLKVIDKNFADLLISYSCVCEAGTTVGINDIDVGFRYTDGSVVFTKQMSENICFLEDKVVRTDIKDNADGSITESTTTSAVEKETYEIKLGENNITVRCRLDDKVTEGTFSVKGVDYTPPEFVEIRTSEASANHGDGELSLTAFSLKGIDNYTAEDELLYALAEKDVPVTDADYTKQSMYAMQARDGAIYVAYVRDACGNVSTKEISVNIKDDIQPVIDAVELEYPDQDVYYQYNKIHVKAHDDQGELTYRYTLNLSDEEIRETGKGAWSGQNFYEVRQNGSYLVEVRDRGGNIVTEVVEVKNVDNIAPVIKSVATFTKAEIAGSNGLIIGHDLNEKPIYGSDGSIAGVIAFDYRGIPIYASSSETPENLIGYDIGGKEIYGNLQEGSETSDRTDGSSSSSGTTNKNDSPGTFSGTSSNGKNGADGINGKDGADGRDGINGTDGRDGINGTDGRDGIDGADGSNGKDGADGKDGRDGRDGNSSFFAYADSVNGSVVKNFHRDTPLPTSKWIGVYSGTSAPSSQSQYTWSQYKTANSVEFNRDLNTVRITINPAQ